MSFEKQVLAYLMQGRTLDSRFILSNKDSLKAEKDVCRKYFLETPNAAYHYASVIDEEPHEETRKAACKKPQYAYEYAYSVDKGPRDDTREAVSKSPTFSYKYALWVDQGPHDITRKGACGFVKTAVNYAFDIDKEARWDTYDACQNNYVSYKARYIRRLGKPKC